MDNTYNTSMTRVVVTGMGAITSLGSSVQDIWGNVVAGKSGIRTIPDSDLPSKVAGFIDDVDCTDIVTPSERRRLDPFCLYGLYAAYHAVRDAGIGEPDQPLRYGVLVGSGIGGMTEIYNNALKSFQKGMSRVSPFFIPKCLTNMLSGHISQKFNCQGPTSAVVTACATGSHAIADATRIIRAGEADVMICGGSEAAVLPIGLAGFCAANALSTRYNDKPTQASRPFDKNRDGFVMSDGAAILVLESEAHARKRGARIYAEIAGYGMTGDAYHITAPPEDGRGARNAMLVALRHAGLASSDIDYINAHATSTPLGDRAEMNAIRAVFHHPNLCISATKSCTGHLLGAAGSLEAVLSIMAINDNIAPPTINLDEPEFEGFNLVPHVAQERAMRCAMSNSFGFGGMNACLIFKKYDTLCAVVTSS